MTLDDIKSMWEKDAQMDMDNLHDESLKIPQLHQKYYTIYTTIKLLRQKALDTYSKVRLERYNYYSGKAPAEVYVEEPFPYKVRDKESMSMHMDADDKVVKAKIRIEVYNTMIEYLEDILKMVHARGYQIKNSVDFLRFQAGMGF